jgi:hypothetical protein
MKLLKNKKNSKKNMVQFLRYYITGFLLLIAIFPAYTQETDNLNKELILVRPYEPSVMDAQKISILPDLKDTFRVKPAFENIIRSKRIDTRLDVTPITAAKLQPLPQKKLHRGYIKVGFETAASPHAEVVLNTLRNKEYALGAILNYDASLFDFEKVKLENGERVEAGYSDAGAKLFGQKFFRSSYLYGDAGISGATRYNYGYNTEIDTTLEKDDIRKKYIFGDANIGIRSSQFKTDELNYNVQLGYQYAGNKTDSHGDWDTIPTGRKFNENTIRINAQLDNNMFGGNIDFEHYSRSNAFDSLKNNFALGINPWFIMDNDSIRFEVGMRISAYKEGDGNLQYKIYPKVEFQFTLLKDIFIPFVGIDGNLKTNTYRSLIEENPFITPGLSVPITNTKMQIYAGIQGSLTTKFSYYLRIGFTTSDKEHLFVNDTTYSKAGNYFTIVTDDLSIFSFTGELYYNPIERLELRLKADYNNYQPSKEKYAWHKPGLTTEFSAKYNLYNKILLSFDMYGMGVRYAKAFEPDVEYKKLKSAFDFNFGAEYRYTKSLSFFFKLNNFTGSKYYRWNYYPSKRFSATVGFTYSL